MSDRSHTRRGPLLDHLDDLEARCKQGDITLGEVIKIFGADGHFVAISFLIIPFLQPIPLLGLSTPFGMAIAFFSVLAHVGRPPYLGKRLADLRLSANTVHRIASISETVFEKVTFFSHPRYPLLFRGIFRQLNLFVLVVNSVLLALPLPIPFSNAIPAWAVATHALAQLEEDGVFVVISYLQTVACLGYFLLIAKGVGVIVGRILGFL